MRNRADGNVAVSGIPTQIAKTLSARRAAVTTEYAVNQRGNATASRIARPNAATHPASSAYAPLLYRVSQNRKRGTTSPPDRAITTSDIWAATPVRFTAISVTSPTPPTDPSRLL